MENLCGRQVNGVAHYRHQDQPWYICEFEPTSEFELYRHIFDEFAALVNAPSEKSANVIADFYETKIASLDLRVVPFGNVWGGDIIVAQIYDGAEAWLRPI